MLLWSGPVTGHGKIKTVSYTECTHVVCLYICILGGPNKTGTVLEVKGWEGETDVSFVDRN